MFSTLWHDFLYQPIFNVLIWLYNNWAQQNLGWAVILLTIGLRTVLLPFSIISESNKMKNDEVQESIRKIEKEFSRDEVLKKQEIRRLLRKSHVSPWAKILVLGVQALVFVLLYQVFVRGMTGDRILKLLYPSVDYPGVINIMFYGFDLRERYDILGPAIVGVWLFLEIYHDYRKRKVGLRKADLVYSLLFPIGVFFALWSLPLVKSLFVLTSMLYSAIIGAFIGVFLHPKKPKETNSLSHQSFSSRKS